MKASTVATIVAIVAVVAIGIVAAVNWLGPAGPSTDRARASQGQAAIGGPFSLVDQDGRPVTDADFRGRYMLIYFGYTYCPDVCPTTLARNAAALDLLGDAAKKIQPIMITVDPQRDTPALLKSYVKAFDPRLIGLTGTKEQVAAAAKAYRVYYAKAEEQRGPDAYLMDHSSFTYLMGPDGRFLQFFRPDISPEQMAEKLKAAL